MVEKSRSLVCGNNNHYIKKRVCLSFVFYFVDLNYDHSMLFNVVNDIGQSSWNRVQFCGG